MLVIAAAIGFGVVILNQSINCCYYSNFHLIKLLLS